MSFLKRLSVVCFDVATVLSEMPNVRGEGTVDISDHILDIFVTRIELASQCV